jgi:hypothetical protein
MLEKISSLGLRTDLYLNLHAGAIRAEEGYWVVETPGNPGYWYGNCLVFPEPPGASDFEAWMAIFEREVDESPGGHRVFRWDGVEGRLGVVEPFLAAGFKLERVEVLTARRTHRPDHFDSSVALRSLSGDHDWQGLLELDLVCESHDRSYDEESHPRFAAARHAARRRVVEAGLGEWWGAFAGDRLLASLGLMQCGDLRRFQQVQTHPDARRQGICSVLVWTASSRALDREPGNTLVMIADEEYFAKEIYRSVGFELTERRVDLIREPRSEGRAQSL